MVEENLTEELKNIIEPEPFEAWLLDNLQDILYVKKLLSETIKNDPEIIKESALNSEGWYGRMTELLADANKYLDIAESDNLISKSKELTDMDRQIKLAYKCAIQRSIRDKIEGLTKSLEQRISLCQSLISYEKQFVYANK